MEKDSIIAKQERSSRLNTVRTVFEDIHATKKWGDLPTLPGSSLDATGQVRTWLQVYLQDLKPGTILLDYGCGPDNWLLSVPAVAEHNIMYVGYDVVANIVAIRTLADSSFIFTSDFDVLINGDPAILTATNTIAFVKDVLMHLDGEHLQDAINDLTVFDTIIVVEDEVGLLELNPEVGGYSPWMCYTAFEEAGYMEVVSMRLTDPKPVSKLLMVFRRQPADTSPSADETPLDLFEEPDSPPELPAHLAQTDTPEAASSPSASPAGDQT